MNREAEAENYFNKLDSNQDGIVSREELQSRPGLDTNKDGTVTEEEAEFFLSGQQQYDLETFKSTGYILIKPYIDLESASTSEDAVVTQAPPVQPGGAADDLHKTAADESLTTPTSSSENTEAESEDPQVYDPWRANQAKEEENGDIDDYDEEDEEDEDERDEDKDEDYDIVDPPTDSQDQETQAEDKYDEHTRTLIAAADEARKAFNDVDRQLADIEREINRINEVIAKDYGPDDEFLALSGQCFEYTDNEYVYKMCPYESCSQRSKVGGSETRLGSWVDWSGPENNKYGLMKFTGGQQCWNGPARSTMVYVHCGLDTQLTSVSEPNRCEYEMHLTTPAFCSKPNFSHDEL